MKKGLLLKTFLLLASLPFLTNCTKDDYSSLPPEFEDITFVSQDGNPTLTAGTEITATAKQSKKGKLLYKAEYKWECEQGIVKTPKYEVIYDQQPENPVTTLILPARGSYKIIFTARYHISGQSEAINYEKNIPGGTIKCKAGTFYYDVTIEKNFKVN